MRKIVEQFIENPTPKLRKQLTSEELRFVQRTKKANQPKEPQEPKKPTPKK